MNTRTLYFRAASHLAAFVTLFMIVVGLVCYSVWLLEQRHALAEVEQAFLQVESRKSAFLRTREPEAARRAERGLATLRDSLVGTFRTEHRAALEGALSHYEAAFTHLVAALRARGLDETAGAEGRFRTSVHAIEDLVAAAGRDDLLVPMLTARRGEKDYIMRRRPEYIDRVHAAVDTLVAHAAGLPSADRREIERLAGRYLQDFDLLVHHLNEVSRAEEVMQEAGGRARALIERVRAEKTRHARRFSLAALLLLLATLSLAAAMTMRTVAGVVRPMRALRRAARRLLAGDAAVQVDLARDDEIGDVARAFNRVSEHVDERRRAEAALRTAEAQQRALLEAMPDLMFRLRRDGTYLDARAPDPALLVAPPDELLGRSIAEWLPRPVARRYLEVIAEALDADQVRVLEYALPLPGGADRTFEARVAPTAPDEVVAVVRDVTDRKHYERGLVEARDRAEEMSRLKDAFVANMSHEIRTPLNGVVGMLELLRETPLDAEQREYVDVIGSSGAQLLHVIGEILDFSKIEAGHLELEHAPFALIDHVEEALDVVAASAAARGLELTYVVEPDVPARLVGDGGRFRQVLVNLLSNAVKFTRAGHVAVTVGRAGTAADGRALLACTVCDTGIGIPPDRLAHVFEAFSQVDASTTRRYGGTGLGLAISRRLAELMGGTLTAHSVEGAGSLFTFTVAVGTVGGATHAFAPAEHPALTGRRLLVAARTVSRHVVQHLGCRWGLDVDAAPSPEAGLARLERGERYDVVVLEVHAAEPAGRLLQHLRAGTQGAAHVVLLTSLDTAPLFRPLADAGRLAVVPAQPLRPPRLLETLSAALAAPDAPGEAALKMSRPKDRDAALSSSDAPRILLAEDNRINQKVALRLLGRLGHRVDVAETGREVLAATARHAYDVILMDVHMAEMDGLEATRALRERLPADAQPYVVALTASASAESREACLAAGMDAFVTKPVSLEALEQALARLPAPLAA